MKYSQEDIDKDARWQDIGNLPSNFFPYSFKKLFIRPLTVLELRLISKAAILKEYVHLIRAINMVISENVMEITIGDFYYILMWLKIASTTKTPYTIDWHCPSKVIEINETKIRLPADGSAIVPPEGTYTMQPCGSHNAEIVHLTKVEILCLDETNFESLPEAVDGVEFDFPRVAILEEVREAIKDPELKLIAGPAQWIKGGTLAEKIAVLEKQPNLDLFDLAAALDESVIHGISEDCKLTCRSCLKSYAYKFDLDPLSFFR